MWGENNVPFTVGEDWSLCYKGNENHPLFKGLTKKSGVDYISFFLSKGTNTKGHNAIWNFDWGDYEHNAAGWQTAAGSKILASLHWDVTMSNRAVIFEYLKRGNAGRTICIGSEAYDWYNENNSPANAYKSNIELLTANALEYLAN